MRRSRGDRNAAEDLEAPDKSPDKIVTVIRVSPIEPDNPALSAALNACARARLVVLVLQEVMDAANDTLAKESVAYKQLSGGQSNDSRTQPIRTFSVVSLHLPTLPTLST